MAYKDPKRTLGVRLTFPTFDAFTNAVKARKVNNQKAGEEAIKSWIAGSGVKLVEPPPKKDELAPSERAWVEKLLLLLRSDQEALRETVQAALEAHARSVRQSRKRAGSS